MARDQDALETYNRKRDFSKTAEPAGGREKLAWGDGDGFMIQKHDATRLHYDLRLELDGVLKSWAVPNGPSLDPADKRLAIRTEDHPLAYATFEGTIPKDEYGGGTVMLWDRGVWEPVPGKDPRQSLKKGHLHFTVHGERMKGEWILIRLSPRPGDKKENWILRKVADEHVGNPTGLTDKYLTSIKTGRSMQEIAAGKKANLLPSWKRKPKRLASARTESKSRNAAGALPAFREPQKATLVDHVPSGSGWIHEMKYDGYRCQLAVGGGRVAIFTRKGLDWSDKFPEIAEAAAGLVPGSALLDGEIVRLDEKGNTGFSALQQAISEGGRGLTLFLFDALEIEGETLTGLPNIERKARLAELVGEGRPPFILYADHIVGKGEQLFDAMCEAGQEGIISKRADAPYRGARTRNWLKVKCTNRQEFVIVGWTPSESKGRALRSLLLALNESGKLRYAGKVGTGFSMKTLQDLSDRLRRIEVGKAPVAVPRAEARGAHWVKPQLVAEIAFAEFTSDGVVRHASFLGLRGDKPATEVVAERPQSVPHRASASTPLRTGDTVKISNPGRTLFPEAGITKGDLADYLRAVAPLMLPWAASRPLTLVRCPGGRGKKCFFQKHDAGTFGDKVRRIPIEEKKGQIEDYLFVDDQDGLVTLIQMGTIEIHGWGSRIEDVEKPDRLVFDIDPDVGLGFDHVKKAARDLRAHLADIGLQSFPMLTGGKGVHVVVPLQPEARWPQVKDFAQRFATALATAEPDRFTANLAKASRKGRMFLDYLRNQRGATAILPYSARAREGAPVAAPVHWDELDGMESGASFTVRDADLLVERATGLNLQGWGESDQVLPDL
ncbi:DNA ligase D [Sphingosinicella sp. CPCC 101087]|uniref:DNA ligase D n=1 Tax=Sphingosinicella sp. CPCC 101087 TaxID=2497754 RepID=UPI00101BA948|nr:DNA ligase D [Sphingosinicella sp. CPCC 101087]